MKVSQTATAPKPFNKTFQLNKQLVLTVRKLEDGPLENYTHMATLIHKVNLLLLEFDKVSQLKNTLQLVFSKKLLDVLIDFCTNTDNFANFGLRLLEILSLHYCAEVIESGIISVCTGLLRTNDYETVAQCLSLISVLADGQVLAQKPLQQVVSPKMLTLVLKTVAKTCEIEYVHYLLGIVSHALRDKELRAIILGLELKPTENDSSPYTYVSMLAKHVEKQSEVISIPKLYQRVVRQRKEVEYWHKTCTGAK